jgi:glycosyltransferase involved in cell wall biosynthesis
MSLAFAWLVLTLPVLHVAFVVYGTLRTMMSVREVPHHPLRSPMPMVSMVVPACNEADTLEAAMRAKLSAQYPNLEILLVNDRSTDATGKIADRLAAEDPRVRALHVRELPEGWLGKLYALHRGTMEARGEWLLYCDADIHLSRSILQRVVAEAEAEGLDYVSLIPRLRSGPFLRDVAFATMLRGILMGGRPWKFRSPRSSAAAGSGVFALVRRSAYAKTPGFEHLRLEVADDVAFAQMLKRAGASCGVYLAKDDATLDFYPTLGALARGFEKNAYAGLGGYNVFRHYALTMALLAVELGPYLALLVPEGRVLGALCILLLTGAQALLAHWSGHSVARALVPSLGAFLFIAFIARAGYLVERNGFVEWRGTRYPLDLLRPGRRFEP